MRLIKKKKSVGTQPVQFVVNTVRGVSVRHKSGLNPVTHHLNQNKKHG